MRKIDHDLPEKNRTKTVAILNKLLATHIDLYMQCKQAHWNIRGANFIALHEMLDAIATNINGYVDELAERAVQLGGDANGTLQQVAKTTVLKSYPHATSATAHLNAVHGAIVETLKHLREDIDTTDDLKDAVTADLLTGIAASLDKHLWFIDSHLE